MSNQVSSTVKEVLLDLADSLETGSFGPKTKVGLTINGSELGFDVMRQAAYQVKQAGQFDLVLIGEKLDWTEDFEHYEATTEEEVSKTLDKLLKEDVIQSAVTLHHPFPIGVATIGRLTTPALGREMYIASTTGTTATVRNEAMLLNAIYGTAVAKAGGIEEPRVGILNVDGANIVERSLNKLIDGGYSFTFGESQRSDGGSVLRGNDVLLGSVDVLVCDSLTGNILMKLLSSFNSGGTYETVGYGYGPGVGVEADQIVHIISRASGAPVIANALQYAYEMAEGKVVDKVKAEYKAAKKAGLEAVVEELQPKAAEAKEEFEAPEAEVVTTSISGIDVLDLEDAVQALMRGGIYAESGMGCAGPVVMVSDANEEKAVNLIKEAGLL